MAAQELLTLPSQRWTHSSWRTGEQVEVAHIRSNPKAKNVAARRFPTRNKQVDGRWAMHESYVPRTIPCATHPSRRRVVQLICSHIVARGYNRDTSTRPALETEFTIRAAHREGPSRTNGAVSSCLAAVMLRLQTVHRFNALWETTAIGTPPPFVSCFPSTTWNRLTTSVHMKTCSESILCICPSPSTRNMCVLSQSPVERAQYGCPADY